MKELVVIAALTLSPSTPDQAQVGTQVAGTCFKSGEQSSGSNKICYYKCLSGTVAITVGALDFCPLSINQ